VYERLINFCDDAGTKDALQFLMTREITHMKAFMAALESMGKDPLQIGEIAPTPGVVNKFFNDSSGEGDEGETDERGPWNEDGFDYIEAPAKPVAEGTGQEVIEEIVKATRRGGSVRSQSQPRSKRALR
jgi:Mn-containing catalase